MASPVGVWSLKITGELYCGLRRVVTDPPGQLVMDFKGSLKFQNSNGGATGDVTWASDSEVERGVTLAYHIAVRTVVLGKGLVMVKGTIGVILVLMWSISYSKGWLVWENI